MDNSRQYVKIVNDEMLHIMVPESAKATKLTSMFMSEAIEITPIDLGEYEGMGDSWINF